MPLEYKDFEKFADDIARQYPVMAIRSAMTAMDDALLFLLGSIPEYPPEPASGELLPPDGVSWLKTDRQRRWFFAAVRSGELQGWKWIDNHPEKVGSGRTGNLGRAKHSYTKRGDDYVEGVMGIDPAVAPYAPWVVGADYPGENINGVDMYQAQIHIDRWWQFESIIEANIDEAWTVFGETFWEEFSQKINEKGG